MLSSIVPRVPKSWMCSYDGLHSRRPILMVIGEGMEGLGGRRFRATILGAIFQISNVNFNDTP